MARDRAGRRASRRPGGRVGTTLTRSATHARIYAIVRRIPRGRVATYGQVAELAGLPRQPRLVGYALAALDDDRIPWQRVFNARGEVSPRKEPGGDRVQRELLRRDGVRFDARGRICLEIFGWKPRARVR